MPVVRRQRVLSPCPLRESASIAPWALYDQYRDRRCVEIHITAWYRRAWAGQGSAASQMSFELLDLCFRSTSPARTDYASTAGMSGSSRHRHV